jgi:hypothetical protein
MLKPGIPVIAAALLACGLASAVPTPAQAARRSEQCVRLESRIDLLRLKLRAGYTAAQGRLWKEQLRGLEAQRRASCR